MSTLILVRHGQSQWNREGRFQGWVDVPLSETGILESQMAAESLSHITIDVAFVSRLSRAQMTVLTILSAQKQTGIIVHEDERRNRWQVRSEQLSPNDIPIYSTRQLNERYYGRVQGMNKDDACTEFGKETVFRWRRSYRARPPGGESLAQAFKRVLPYFRKRIMGELTQGRTTLLVAHGNTLRAIIKHIENIPEEDVPLLDIPTAEPIIYEYEDGALTHRAGFRYSLNQPLYWTSDSDDTTGD
ncbi:histidine phosphatase family protein [Patescibacteria group bacterium]